MWNLNTVHLSSGKPGNSRELDRKDAVGPALPKWWSLADTHQLDGLPHGPPEHLPYWRR